MPGAAKPISKPPKPADTPQSDTPRPVASKLPQPSVTSEKSADGLKSDRLLSAEAKEGSGNNSKGGAVRKFSLGGDAWNKKSNPLKKRNNSRIKSADTVDDDDDEGR